MNKKENQKDMKTTKKTELLEKVQELDNLLTERISELHEIKGMMQARHAYIFYRRLLYEIRDIIHASFKETN